MGPNLDDPRLFECRSGVPILDVHNRKGLDVDADRLKLVAENSNRRAAAGEYGLMLLGHTDDEKPEAEQPPVVGFMKNYRMSQHDGRAAIVADLYYDKADAARLMKNYPRRSVEVYYSRTQPEQNFIDGLALLVRTPARFLGLQTYAAGNRQKERYSMADSDSSPTMGITEADIPSLQEYMLNNRILDMATGIKAFLQAKADGTDKPGEDDFGRADYPKIENYAKSRNLDLSAPGVYESTLIRYKRDRNAGTLDRL